MHTAKAASDGLLAAYLARSGFTGARRILEGKQGLAAGTSRDSDPEKLTEGLGARWAIMETSFKWHACCRHTHPAADALAEVMRREHLTHADIAAVTTLVHQGAIDVLGAVRVPSSIHQAKFSMGTVLGLIAVHGKAGLAEFEAHPLTDPLVAAFRDKVAMVLDPEVDAAYPQRWIGKVEVLTIDGRRLTARVDAPKGDPDNALSRAEVEDKAIRLAGFRNGAEPAEMQRLIARIWQLDEELVVGRLLGA